MAERDGFAERVFCSGCGSEDAEAFFCPICGVYVNGPETRHCGVRPERDVILAPTATGEGD